MRPLFVVLLLTTAAFAQTSPAQLAVDDVVRIREFYRLASQIENQIWPDWSKTPAPLLLVTPDTEFLTHYAEVPKDFKKAGDDLYARPRQFPTNLLATFLAFGPPSVIVIGEPKNTASKTSTPWLMTLMHEHFHQLQNAQPGYYQAVQDLGLSHGDNTGMWMLNYPFPYEKPDVAQSFTSLRDLLLSAVNETDKKKFATLAKQYILERREFFAQLSSDDHKYLSFQLWQEGIARYTEIKVAEAAAQYQPIAEYAALSDFESFTTYAARARTETLNELRQADIAKSKRLAVYSFGAAEGLLLDRVDPKWKDGYFEHLLSTDSFFATSALSSEAADDASVLDKIHKRLTSPEKLTYHNPIVFVGEISKMGPVYQGICKQAVNQDVEFTVSRLLFGNYHDSLVHTGYTNCTTRPLPSPPFTLHIRVIVYCERFQHSVHCLDPIEFSDEHLKNVESWIATALTLSPSAQAPDSSFKTGMVRQLSDVKFPSGESPECLQFVLEAGDPKRGPPSPS